MLWLVETPGGIERGALRHLNTLSKRITGKKGQDRTKYSTHPLAPKTYVAHHMQRLSAAAVKGDAKGVRKRANQLKRQVCVPLRRLRSTSARKRAAGASTCSSPRARIGGAYRGCVSEL